MNWLIKRTETEALADGTRLIFKKDGSQAIIERQCQCGDWLHYEVRMGNDNSKYPTVWQHLEIIEFFELVI